MTEPKTLSLSEAAASLLAPAPEPKAEEEPKVAPDPEEPDEVPEPPSEVEEESDDDPAEEDVPDEVEPFYEVTVDGESHKLKLKDLIDGYRRGHNYETKAEKLREEREAAQRELAAVTQKRTEYDQRLAALEVVLTQDDPDLELLLEKDPGRYLRIKAEREKALRKVQAERQKVAAEHQQHIAVEFKKHVEAEKQKMLSAIPEWRDDKRRGEEQPKITAFAKSVGFSDAELQGLTDHRAVVVLRDAWLYRQGKSLKEKQAVKAPKTVPPGKPPTRAETTGREVEKKVNRLRQTGKIEDAVSVLLARNK